MAPLVSHVSALWRSEHLRRLWKYAWVSVVSTLVTQVVLFLTYHAWNLGPAWVCNVIATVVASIPAYYLNRTWTWGKRGRSRVWGEVVPFWAIALIAMVLSTLAVVGATHYADQYPRGSLDRALVINGANLITYAVMWTARYFVLNRFLFGTRSLASPPGPHPEPASGEVPITAVRAGGLGDLGEDLPKLAATETNDPAG
ncbi:MAG: GtrA family protein [Acidimicrobiales bacterium]|jgi:putative flippase GtrA